MLAERKLAGRGILPQFRGLTYLTLEPFRPGLRCPATTQTLALERGCGTHRHEPYSTTIEPRMPNMVCMVWVQRSR